MLTRVGVFGDGAGRSGWRFGGCGRYRHFDNMYLAGSGYAVLEVYNPATNINLKIVATWESLVSPKEALDRPIIMAAAGDPLPDGVVITDGASALKQGYCWIGNIEALLSDDPAKVQAALADLRKAGWR